MPYELGALPPLQPNCCILSKLAEFKLAKQRGKTKRGNRFKSQQQQQLDNATTTDDGIFNTDDADNDMDGDTDATTTSPTKPKTSVNIVSSTNSNLSTMDFMASTLAACSEDEKEDTNALSQLLIDSMSLPGSSMPSSSSSTSMTAAAAAAAIVAKKKGLLVDAFGQPRKSPREHASTLAILSSLVQQRRKRIKEMNGGISPEKMPSYRAAVAAAIAAHQSSAENSGIDDHDDFNDDYDDLNSADAMSITATLTAATVTKPSPDAKVMCSPTTRRRSNQTPVSDICKSPISPNENGPRRSSTEQSDKFFRLRKVKRRQTESLSSTADSVIEKTDEKGDKDDKQTAESVYPKMPVDDYIDPIKLQRELEQFFEASFLKSDMDLELDGIQNNDTMVDLSSNGKQNDLVELLKTVKDGPLSYRTLTRTKKRHINRTGWPSLPRKRQPKREKQEDVVHTDEDGQPSITNDDEPDRLSDIDEEELITTAEAEISERRDIRSPFCDDNAVPFAMFASSSEKAENSDIFTVSSDSYLDTDMNDTASKSRSTPVNNSPLVNNCNLM